MAMRGASVVTYDDECMTGGCHEVLEALKLSVAAYCRSNSNVKKMYIGIASGNNADDAMKRRYDDYKKEEGINHMVALYSSTSQNFASLIEKDLVDYFKDEHQRNINRTGGGGGRPSEGPNYYVYLAMRRWG
eukprot:Em0015g409a